MLFLLTLISSCHTYQPSSDETTCTIPPPPLQFVINGLIDIDSITLKSAEDYNDSNEYFDIVVLHNDTLQQTIIFLDGSTLLGNWGDYQFLLQTPQSKYPIVAQLKSYQCSYNCECYSWSSLSAEKAVRIDSGNTQPSIYF